MPEPIRRRSFAVPPRPPHRMRHSLGSYDTSIPSNDVLFHHPSVTVIKFELPQSSSPGPILPDLDYPVDAIETLPWRTRSETIAAIGALRIENIAGSAAFLKSGNVVYALLKNCQCWCVDARSTFVLRIRKLTYYRIEFPHESEEDVKKVAEWKLVLSSIIRYEITPCPFKREFSVELPEEAKTPKKKRAWRPKTMAGLPVRPFDFEGSLSSEDREPSDFGSIGYDTDEQSERGGSLPPSTTRCSSRDRRSSPIRIPKRSSFRVVSEPAPKFESLLARFESESETVNDARDGSAGVASSASSFHSVSDASVSPPPSPPYSTPPSPRGSACEPSPCVILKTSHTRDNSAATIVPDTTHDSGPLRPPSMALSDPPKPLTSCEPGDLFPRVQTRNGLEVPIENPNSIIRRRIRASRQRSFSPLPPSSTLFTPAPKSPVNNLIDAIFEKTYTFVLGPPIHLLLMFLRLAAEMAAKDNNRGPAGPGSGKFPTQPETMSDTDDSFSEDDFGNPLSPIASANLGRDSPTTSESSSEVD
uniref:Inheritance of peroxisomes protein 1 n=1 Tax=Coccidioides posadasii RMSCC 3488 TaxID=454284 RepID=A0A0J6FNK9_COCPO|nr:hypothetical protein CPAG_07327 [Coccidioides posadasii RMSCC 3488]